MYFLSFCLSLVFHGRGVPCRSPAVVGEYSIVPFPLISLFYWRNVLMETFSVFITHCTTLLWGKNPNASEGSVFLVTCCSLISGSSAKGCLQAPYSFEPFFLKKKNPFTTNLKLSQAAFSSPWRSLSKYSSLIRSRICGPMKIPSFNFASLSLGNFSRK